MVGLDIGSAWIGVSSGSRVIREPAAVAVDARSGHMVAVGAQAELMAGRTGATVEVTHPVLNGLAAAPEHVLLLLRHTLRRALGWRRLISRPRVVVSLPLEATPLESEALAETLRAAGTTVVRFLSGPVAAGRGAGLDPSGANGFMLVDLGARQTQAAILYRGSLLSSESRPVGGNHMNAALVRWLQDQLGLVISDGQAEALKMGVGDLPMTATGWDVHSGSPTSIAVSREHVAAALQQPLAEIGSLVRSVLLQTPPEMASDLLSRGITLTGGGARLYGLPQFLASISNLPVKVALHPETCAARGCQVRR